jgi:hypothetical protein
MLRRARGLLLRFTRRRRLALAVGLLLAVPAVWIELGEVGDAWWVSGVALVMGATGIALIWTGLTGVPPDFVDPDERG